MHRYNKLVRDNVPEIEMQKGRKIATHTASSDQEYWMQLLEKLQVSIDAFAARNDLESLADALESLDAIMDFKKIDRKELQAVKENMKIGQGGYSKRVILEASEEKMGPGELYT